jgi:hypothetical protein
MLLPHQNRLIEYLQKTLSLPPEAIALGWRQSGQSLSLLPIVLWQYGLVDTQQLAQIWDWLEQVS